MVYYLTKVQDKHYVHQFIIIIIHLLNISRNRKRVLHGKSAQYNIIISSFTFNLILNKY